MIDLDRLFAEPVAPGGPNTKGPACDLENASEATPNKANKVAAGADDVSELGASGASWGQPNFGEVAPPKTAWIKASEGLGPVGPLHFSGREEETTPPGPVEGAAGREFALDFSAIALLMAWHGKARGSTDKAILMDLAKLKTMEPGEQVRYWHGRCMEKNLKPWMILARPASLDGMDCTFCKHLTTRQYANPGERRRFDWACGLGYLILETGRGTERIWIAPPECHSYERWVPGSGKQVVHQFLGND